MAEEIFFQPFEPEDDHDHGFDASTSKEGVLSTEESLALLATLPSVAEDLDDSERRARDSFGPHELWEQEEEDGEEQEALDKAARLRAADEDAASLQGELGGTVESCGPSERLRAIEVELCDDEGPIIGGSIELRRKGQNGAIALRSDGKGRARFEGLLPADAHQLRVLGQGPWRLESTQALPADRAKSSHPATWPEAAAKSTGATHEVAQGECLWTLANRHGLDPDALWEANPELHTDDRLPNVLAPGDVVLLSEGEPELADVGVAQAAVIHCKPAKAKAKIDFQDDAGKPRSGLEFVALVVTASGVEHSWSGTTNGKGGLDEEVPADAVSLEITLSVEPEAEVHHFRFAHLDPVSTISGVQGRLFNLGFWSGDERGEVGPLTCRALREFQAKYELPQSAEIDDATRAKLVELYGS